MRLSRRRRPLGALASAGDHALRGHIRRPSSPSSLLLSESAAGHSLIYELSVNLERRKSIRSSSATLHSRELWAEEQQPRGAGQAQGSGQTSTARTSSLQKSIRFYDVALTLLRRLTRLLLSQLVSLPCGYEIMRNSMPSTDGHRYERIHIERWFQSSKTSQMTGATLSEHTTTHAHPHSCNSISYQKDPAVGAAAVTDVPECQLITNMNEEVLV